MVCSETQNEAGRNGEPMGSLCDARQDSRNGRSLSHKTPQEGRKVEDVNGVSLPSSCDGARRDGKNGQSLSHIAMQEVKKAESVSEEEQNHTQPKESAGIKLTDFDQSGRCSRGLSCKIENVDRDAGTQAGNSRNKQSANVTVKDSSVKAEGTHEKPACFVQVMVTFLIAWATMAACTGMSFPGVVLPQFTDPDTDDLYLEPQTLSLFVSLSHVGTMVGSLVAGQLLTPLGARLTILIGLPLAMLAWLGLFFSSQLWILMTCRVLQGCTFALVKPPAIMYLVEMAHESLRGRLVGMLGIAKEIGFFSSYLLGGLMLTWRQLSLVYTCILVPPAIGVFFLPNSPRWLTIHGHVTEARKSLVFFRGRHCDVEAELVEVIRQANEAGSSSSTLQQLRLLLRPRTLKMFFFVLTMFVVYPLHGSSMLSSYLMIILDTPGAPVDLSLSSFLCSITKIAGGITHLLTIDYLGRVPIMVVSFCFMSACTFIYGYYTRIYFLDLDNPYSATWIPLATVITFHFLAGVSGPIFDILQGELLPNACRAASMPIISLLNGLSVFGAVSSFYYLLDLIGRSGLFGLFTAVNIALAVVCLLVMPETRGLSLEAISDAVHSSKHKVMKKPDGVNKTGVDSSKSA